MDLGIFRGRRPWLFVLASFLSACSAGSGDVPQVGPSSSDVIAPTVSALTPTDGTTSVVTDAAIVVEFSEEMDPASLTSDTIVVRGAGGPVPGQVTSSGSKVTFAADAHFDLNTTYSILVTTDVRDLNQNHLAADYTSSFNTWVQDTAVGLPRSIEDLSSDASDPQVVLDESGNGMVVWVQQPFVPGSGTGTLPFPGVSNLQTASASPTLTTPSLWFNRYDSVNGWQGAAQIDTGAFGIEALTQIASDGNGNVFVVWDDGCGPSVARYDAGSGQWSSPQSPHAGPYCLVFEPHVDSWAAINKSGDVVVVWVTQTTGLSTNYLYYGQQFDSSTGTWSDVQRFGSVASNPQVAIDEAGNALVVWIEQCHPPSCGVVGIRYVKSANAWEPQGRLSNEAGRGAGNPRVALSPIGDAIVVWDEWDGLLSALRMWSTRRDVSLGAWDAPQVVGEDAGNRQLRVDDGGNALLVWERVQGAGWWSVRGVPGNGWHPPEFSANRPRNLVLAGNGPGDAVGVGTTPYRSWNGSADFATLTAVPYLVGQGWNEPVRVSDRAVETSRPVVALNTQGMAIIAWLQRPSGSQGILDVWANHAYLGISVTP